MTEIWKPVIGYEGIYEVSNLGRVRSLDRSTSRNRIKGVTLKPAKQPTGYLAVSLCKANKSKSYTVHRLVAQAFIPNPDSRPQVNHIDYDRGNNVVSNLEWNTAKENIQHGVRTFRNAYGERHADSKLTEAEARRLHERHKDGVSFSVLGREFGVTPSAAHKLVRGITWKHLYRELQHTIGETHES